MSDLIIIGVDHGYAAMKTAHFSFPTGLVEYEHEPYTQKDVLEYSKIRQMAVIYMGYKRKVTQVVTQMEKAVTYNVSVALTADGLCSQIRRSS